MCRYVGCSWDGEPFSYQTLDEAGATLLCGRHKVYVQWSLVTDGTLVLVTDPPGTVEIREVPELMVTDAVSAVDDTLCWFVTCRRLGSEYRTQVERLPKPGQTRRVASVRARACNEHDALLDEAKRLHLPIWQTHEGLLWVDTLTAVLEGR